MMLRLFTSELRKLLNLRVGLVIGLLLAVNLVSMHFTLNANTQQIERYEKLAGYQEAFRQLEKVYEEDPDYYVSYYAELREKADAAYAEWNESIGMFPAQNDNGNDFYEFHYFTPSTLVEGYEDLEIMELYETNGSDFRSILENAIQSAQNNLSVLERFGIGTSNETGNYQRKLITLYSGVLEQVDRMPTVVMGWDIFLTYENRLIFVFLAALLLAVQMGYADRESGVEPVLRVCRRGRWQPALAKCGVLLAAVMGISLFTNLSELLYVGLRIGLSSPLRSVQNVEAYIYCPYALSILEACLMNLAGMILAAAVLGGICLCLTILTRQVILPLIAGGLILAGNLVLHWWSLLGEWRVFNLIEPASGRLLKRAPVIALIDLGNCLYPLEMELIAGLLLLVFAAIWLSALYRRPTVRVRRKKRSFSHRKGNLLWGKEKKIPLSATVVSSKPLKTRHLSLLRGEVHKWVSPLLLAVLMILVGVRAQQAIERFDPEKTDVEQRLLDYVEHYGGVISDEKIAAVDAELQAALELISDEIKQRYTLEYATGKISSEAYFAYQQAYAQACSALPVLSELNAHMHYLQAKQNETGLDTAFFYENGYIDFWNISFDLPLYLMILLGISSIFPKEYQGGNGKGGFIQIMHTAKRGRGPVFCRKCGWSLIYAGGLSILYSLLDICLLYRSAGLPSLNAPLCSMERYAAAVGITVGGYLLLCLSLRVLGALLLALLTATFSCLLESTKLALSVTALLTLLPYALYSFGLKFARYFDFTALLSGDRLCLISLDRGGVAFSVFFVAAIAALTGGLIAASYKKFCR